MSAYTMQEIDEIMITALASDDDAAWEDPEEPEEPEEGFDGDDDDEETEEEEAD